MGAGLFHGVRRDDLQVFHGAGDLLHPPGEPRGFRKPERQGTSNGAGTQALQRLNAVSQRTLNSPRILKSQRTIKSPRVLKPVGNAVPGESVTVRFAGLRNGQWFDAAKQRHGP